MNKNYLMRKIRGNLLIRFILSPYLNYKKKKEFIEYINSVDSAKMKMFKNIHNGKRCFILGNGPSLKSEDLDLLKSEITIAGNRIYDMFQDTEWRPKYYFAVDTNGMKEFIPILEKIDIEYIFLNYTAQKYEKEKKENVIYINCSDKKYVANIYNDKSAHISEDISLYFSRGYTVLFTALQFAIYTGIKEIYLVGVDFEYSWVSNKWGKKIHLDGVKDYFDGKEHKGSFLNYESVLYAWKMARKYCDEHEIKIYNATRGGKLEVFERIELDSLFMKNVK